MSAWLLLLSAFLQSPAGAGPALAGPCSSGVTVRITSPLGRSGIAGTIRIVAQVRTDAARTGGAVRFYIDQQLFKTDADGPPYMVEWDGRKPVRAA